MNPLVYQLNRRLDSFDKRFDRLDSTLDKIDQTLNDLNKSIRELSGEVGKLGGRAEGADLRLTEAINSLDSRIADGFWKHAMKLVAVAAAVTGVLVTAIGIVLF